MDHRDYHKGTVPCHTWRMIRAQEEDLYYKRPAVPGRRPAIVMPEALLAPKTVVKADPAPQVEAAPVVVETAPAPGLLDLRLAQYGDELERLYRAQFQGDLAAWDGLHVETPDGARYHLSTAEGLPNDNILGLAVDDLGNVWAATFSHLSRIKPIREGERLDFAVASYGGEDGMNAGALFQNALALGADGRLYAGGAHGFCIVDPSSLYQPSYNRTPVISRLRIFDRPVEVGEELNGRCILPRELGQMEHLDLRHDETFLTFEFSNLNYTNPSHTVYRYRLENFDREWTEIHARGTGSATYTLLEPGDYVFRVTAADNDTDRSGKARRRLCCMPWRR